ncbi:MAG: molecular chaperone DnaJ [Armatimonadetes bacterium]|nr:molecular chaperone DnaJ [Armatimonadota bacterium]
MEYKDYYKTLGVERTATEKDIKQAYRRLARKYHPDVNPGNKEAEDKFKDVSEAYEVLSDPEKRSKYDQYGQHWEQAARGGAPGGGFTYQPGGPGGYTYQQGDADFDLGGGFSDFFENLFGGGRAGAGGRTATQSRPQTGANLEQELEVTLEEALNGSSRHLSLRIPETCPECKGSGDKPGARPQTCPDCKGSGRIRGMGGLVQNVCPRCGGAGQVVLEPCPRCQGQGTVERNKRLEVKIPAGVDTGSKIRLQGEGMPGQRGGPSGDLYLVVKLKPHPVFERKGDHLYTEVPVSFPEAALGAEIRVPTLTGKGTLRIPEGTQSGQQFRIAGQGMPNLKTGQRGDEYVKVKVTVPKNLSSQERELVERLADLRRENPRAAA